METAIIYSRVSTKEQANDNQVKQLTDYCRSNGYDIRGVYEEKVSGASTEKEVLDYIMNAEPLADVLVIREVSRLSREDDVIEAASKINQLVKKYTIQIVADRYTIQRGNVMSINDCLLLIVKLYGAADERAKIVMRTAEARKRYKANTENYAAGGVPYGMEAVDNPNYVKGVNTRRIVVPGKEWEKVLEVYRLKSEGLSYTEVSLQVGLDKSLVRNILRNKRIRCHLPEGLADEADRQSKSNDSRPNPTAHANIYKGIIYDGDTDAAMVHQVTSKGSRYLKAGKGAIDENDLNETVMRALQSFVRCFNVRRDDVLTQNTLRLNQLSELTNALRHSVSEKKKEMSALRQKAVRTTEIGLYEEIQKRIVALKDDIEKLTRQIADAERETKNLENVDATNAVIDECNFATYVRRYVKAVRYYPVRRFCRVIRVVIKDEYIPQGYANYKEYEIYKCCGNKYIKALPYSHLDLTPCPEENWFVLPTQEHTDGGASGEEPQDVDFEPWDKD